MQYNEKNFQQHSNLLSLCYSYLYNLLLNQPKNILTEVVLQAARGSNTAQATLYKMFSKAMFNICMRMASNRQQAEDILHDAFIQAFKSMAQLKQPEAIAGWLRRIVVNECIRQSRSSIHWNDWEESHDAIPNEEDDWWKGINLEIVQQEIKNLPDGCRQVFVLFALEDYAHKDIAANLGISESTSKSQYYRSRTLLRERILKQMRMADG